MATSPDLGIPYVPSPPPAQAEVLHNSAINMLLVALKGAVDRAVNAPPGSPTDGDIYIVGAAPTGAWAGKPNKIAIRTGGAWTFIPGNDSSGANIAIGARHEGLKIWVNDEDLLYIWSGSAWAPLVTGGGYVAPAAATMWGITIAPGSINYSSATYCGFGEIEFQDSGATNLSTGGTAMASKQLDGNWTPAKAFNGVTTGTNEGWINNMIDARDEWIGYLTGSAIAPDRVKVWPTSTQTNSFPTQFAVWFSNDYGVTKNIVGVFNTAAPVSGTGQTFIF